MWRSMSPELIQRAGLSGGADPFGTTDSSSATSKSAGFTESRPNQRSVRPHPARFFGAPPPDFGALFPTPPRRPHQGPYRDDSQHSHWELNVLAHARCRRSGRAGPRPYSPASQASRAEPREPDIRASHTSEPYAPSAWDSCAPSLAGRRLDSESKQRVVLIFRQKASELEEELAARLARLPGHAGRDGRESVADPRGVRLGTCPR